MDPLIIAGSTWVAAKVGTEIVKAGGALLTRIAGPSADELGEHYRDRVRAWRSENLIATAAKAQKILEDRGAVAQEVPPRLLWPMLEDLSLCDDETLTDRWAALLANAADPAFQSDIHPSYSAILAELAPHDVLLLSWAYESHNPFEYGSPHFRTFKPEYLQHSKDRHWDGSKVAHSTAVLLRNGVWRETTAEVDPHKLQRLLERTAQQQDPRLVSRYVHPISSRDFEKGDDGVAFTVMGAYFTRACSEAPAALKKPEE